jgi:hypothetical protein
MESKFPGILYNDAALTDPRVAVSPSPLVIDFDSVITSPFEACSSWVDYRLVNIQSEQKAADLFH